MRVPIVLLLVFGVINKQFFSLKYKKNVFKDMKPLVGFPTQMLFIDIINIICINCIVYFLNQI